MISWFHNFAYFAFKCNVLYRYVEVKLYGEVHKNTVGLCTLNQVDP
jgi:hypothetical protein